MLHARVVQLKSEAREGENNEGCLVVEKEDNLISKLYGMSIGERDNLIDTLIGQKGF
jgi:hypothetical protein